MLGVATDVSQFSLRKINIYLLALLSAATLAAESLDDIMKDCCWHSSHVAPSRVLVRIIPTILQSICFFQT